MFMRFLKSKLFISVVLLILAGVLVFGLLPMNYEKQATTLDVVQLVKNVKQGTQISASMLTTRTIGGYNVDKGVITNKDEIIGKYASMDIRGTSNLYSDMFTDTWEEVEGAIDDIIVGEDDQLITLSLKNGASAVGGSVKPGSVVDVYTETLPDEMAESETGTQKVQTMELRQILKNVIVYDVKNNALESISELKRQWISLVESGSSEAENFDKSLTPAYVTLVVSNEQANILATQELSGYIQLVLSPNKDVDDAKEYHQALEDAAFQDGEELLDDQNTEVIPQEESEEPVTDENVEAESEPQNETEQQPAA